MKSKQLRYISRLLVFIFAVFTFMPIGQAVELQKPSDQQVEVESPITGPELSVKPGKGNKIECVYKVEFKPVPDVEFNLFKIADKNSDGTYSWTDTFKGYNVTPPKEDISGLNQMINTLADYSIRDRLIPLEVVKSGEDGTFTFTDLEDAMYMVVGVSYKIQVGNETRVYTPVPFAVTFPYKVNTEGSSSDKAVVEVKHTLFIETETIARHVIKIWHDEGYEYNRPTSISVDLLQDGRVIDTVILSAANNWRYTWEKLDGTHRYSVVESRTPTNYTTSTDFQGGTFIVCNEIIPPTIPPETPIIPIPEPDIPLTIISPPYIPIPDEPEEPPVDIPEPDVPLGKIPQTGQLLWPVPFMAGGGTLSIVLGLLDGIVCKEDKDGKESDEETTTS